MSKRLTKNKVKDLLKQAHGNYAAVARAYGVSRQAVRQFVERDDELREIATETRETMLDNAESKLYSEAMAGNTAALIFLLKTQGKKRGYIERAEVTGANAEAEAPRRWANGGRRAKIDRYWCAPGLLAEASLA